MTARRYAHNRPAPEPIREDDWRIGVPCLEADPELFYVPGDPKNWEQPQYAEQRAEAASYCGRCPAVDKCLAKALEEGDGHAYRGNTTPKERGRIRRKKPHDGRGQKPADKCLRGHDTSKPGSRHPNRTCKACVAENQAQIRAERAAKAATA